MRRGGRGFHRRALYLDGRCRRRTGSAHARRLGYKAKSAVDPGHAAVINRVFTPSEDEVEEARRIVEAFEAAQARGDGRAELNGSLIETPIYRNAQQLLDRYESFAVY